MLKVFLVDDEYMILTGLKRLIDWQGLGLELVGTADNSLTALEFMRQNKIDILITDVNMPMMSGIELVEQAQAENIYFHFLILSGYQEFEYVKAGLRLGAENYLLKPVDKQELANSLVQLKKTIEAEREHQLSEVVLFEHTLQRWVIDDISPVELRKTLHRLNKPLAKTSFSVLVFQLKADLQAELIELFQQAGQQFFYVTPDDHYLIIIFSGDAQGLEKFIAEICQNLPETGFYLGVGELVSEIGAVYSSFNHAFYAVGIHAFYQVADNLLNTSPLGQGTISYLPHLTFEKLSQALLIRDLTTITTEIEQILNQLRQEGAEPDYVRHIIFLIFMDIYRQYEALTEEFYQHYAKLISEALTFNELSDLIFEVVEKTNKKRGLRIYSPNVEATLKIIHNSYDQNLGLKQIAEELYLNVMYLGQLFKKETQKSFSQYLNHYRIKQAQNLLIHSSLNINEISERVGYTSAGYFYKNFKLICGLSPSDFRAEFCHDYQPLDE